MKAAAEADRSKLSRLCRLTRDHNPARQPTDQQTSEPHPEARIASSQSSALAMPEEDLLHPAKELSEHLTMGRGHVLVRSF